jgi:hypothetical protein
MQRRSVEVFLRNAEDAYGFPPYPVLADSLSKWEQTDLHPQEQAIVAGALKQIPVIRLRDPNFNWWQRLIAIAGDASSRAIPLQRADD